MLAEALEHVKGPSSFAGGHADAILPNPGLFVESHGLVGLPLSANDARAIVSKSRKSAFGKATETRVDDSVRRTWELNPGEFSLQNPKWQEAITDIFPQVIQKLSLNRPERIRAELHKLLLYEEGAFFKPHQDSEKTPGMFGTLVVALPSPHQGGELSLRHKKERVRFSTAPHSKFGFSWVAWCVYMSSCIHLSDTCSGTLMLFTKCCQLLKDGGLFLRTV